MQKDLSRVIDIGHENYGESCLLPTRVPLTLAGQKCIDRADLLPFSVVCGESAAVQHVGAACRKFHHRLDRQLPKPETDDQGE